MPSTPSGPGPRARPPGSGRPGPGRDVRLTRALVGVVLAVLLLVTLVTAVRGDGPADGAGLEGGAAEPAPAGEAGGQAGEGGAGGAPEPPAPVLAPLADLRAAAGAPPPTPAGLAAALGPVLDDPALGPRVGAAVVDAATGDLLWAAPAPGDGLVVPASTAKVVTGAAALATLGGDHRLSTRVVAGAAPGEVVLVGGGDPTLAGRAADPGVRHGGTPPARLAALADATASALAGAGTGAVPRLVVDATLFVAPPEPAPGWLPGDLSAGYVGPVSALAVDAGRVRPDRRPRHAEPDLAAGAAFAALLAERGHPVGEVVRGAAPPATAVLAEAESPPVAALVETMLLASDNDLAEALARHVALARGLPADPAGVAAALPAAVAGLGVPPEAVPVTDGSGLSRASRVRPAALAGLVAAAASPARPGLRPVVTGLPTAGFAGTLAERYDGTGSAPAAGRAWAKTGTLTGTSALAGLVVDAEGRLLAFDVTADAVPAGGTLAAEAALDRAVAALAACGCTG